MRCPDAARIEIEAGLGLASTAARARLERHLAGCAGCAARVERERRLTGDLAALRVELPFSIDVTARVAARVARDDARGRDAFSLPQLVWTTAGTLACGLALLLGLTRVMPALPEAAAQGRAVLSGAWTALSALATPALHLLEAVAAVPGRLLATLAPLLSALEELQPVAIGMVALCAVMMATCIVLVVGRDMRQPRWIEEGSR